MYQMQSDRQQQFSWSQDVAPVWKQGEFPSAIWIVLTKSVFFILPAWIPIFFAIILISLTVMFAPLIIFMKGTGQRP